MYQSEIGVIAISFTHFYSFSAIPTTMTKENPVYLYPELCAGMNLTCRYGEDHHVCREHDARDPFPECKA